MALEPSIVCRLPADSLAIFFPLFQQGIDLDVDVGCTVKQLLVEQLGLSADYLAERITTLFLNSKAIDDASTAVVQDGSVLALSGAMPGLVGATMRSGGHLAAMRGAMTYNNDSQSGGVKRGRITLKLFNLLLKEIGPLLLSRGILLSAQRMNNFWKEHVAEISNHDCQLNGQAIEMTQLSEAGDLGGLIRLKVNFGDESLCRSR